MSQQTSNVIPLNEETRKARDIVFKKTMKITKQKQPSIIHNYLTSMKKYPPSMKKDPTLMKNDPTTHKIITSIAKHRYKSYINGLIATKKTANAKSQKTAFIVIGIIVAIIVVAVIASQNVFKIGFSNPPDLNTYVPTILILIILLYICCKW
jgi:uncharacterized integral membrane protein